MTTKVHLKHNRRHPRQARTWLPAVWLIAGLVFLGLLLYSALADSSTASASLDYSPEDVISGESILAVHEMGEGPPIPFLSRNEDQPAIEVPLTFYDFGTIGPQDVVEKTFIIRNTGDAPLTISRAYTTCGCTTADISTNLIPPGKVATIKLVLDAGFHDVSGQTVRRGLIIESNDLNQSQAEIWVQATVRAN